MFLYTIFLLKDISRIYKHCGFDDQIQIANKRFSWIISYCYYDDRHFRLKLLEIIIGSNFDRTKKINGDLY